MVFLDLLFTLYLRRRLKKTWALEIHVQMQNSMVSNGIVILSSPLSNKITCLAKGCFPDKIVKLLAIEEEQCMKGKESH